MLRYTQMGRRVWPYEIGNFLRDRRLKDGPTVTVLEPSSIINDRVQALIMEVGVDTA